MIKIKGSSAAILLGFVRVKNSYKLIVTCDSAKITNTMACKTILKNWNI